MLESSRTSAAPGSSPCVSRLHLPVELAACRRACSGDCSLWAPAASQRRVSEVHRDPVMFQCSVSRPLVGGCGAVSVWAVLGEAAGNSRAILNPCSAPLAVTLPRVLSTEDSRRKCRDGHQRPRGLLGLRCCCSPVPVPVALESAGGRLSSLPPHRKGRARGRDESRLRRERAPPSQGWSSARSVSSSRSCPRSRRRRAPGGCAAEALLGDICARLP